MDLQSVCNSIIGHVVYDLGTTQLMTPLGAETLLRLVKVSLNEKAHSIVPVSPMMDI